MVPNIKSQGTAEIFRRAVGAIVKQPVLFPFSGVANGDEMGKLLVTIWSFVISAISLLWRKI